MRGTGCVGIFCQGAIGGGLFAGGAVSRTTNLAVARQMRGSIETMTDFFGQTPPGRRNPRAAQNASTRLILRDETP